MATLQRAVIRLACLARRRTSRCAADAGRRNISFNWGAPQEVEAAKSAPSLSEQEAQQHRRFIIDAVTQGSREGLVRERLGLLMADKLPFGSDVCFAMIKAGIRLDDLNKITYWTNVAVDEGAVLPRELALHAIVAMSTEAQHTKAAQLVLEVLSDALGSEQRRALVLSDPASSISDDNIQRFVQTQPASVLVSASTSLIKAGHVSLAFRLQRAVVTALNSGMDVSGTNEEQLQGLIACLERMSVLWLPAGEAEACLQAYSSLSQAGYSMPLSLISQLLHAAADAKEWQLCVDVLNARHQIDVGEAALLAMDSSLKPIIVQAFSSAGVETASVLLSSASAWLGHSMPESADALATLLVQHEQWPDAQAVAQHLLRRPRGRTQAPPPMACVGAIAGHLLMQGQGHAAARMLFAAVRAWDGRWRVPADVSDAWLKAELAVLQPPPDAAAAAPQPQPQDWMHLPANRPVAPWIGTPVQPPRSSCSGLAASSALLAHGLAHGHSPSAFACTAVAQAAITAKDYCTVLEVAADAIVSVSFDALVPSAQRRPPAQQWSPRAVDALTAATHAAATALLQQGSVAPVAAFARIAADSCLMHVGKADAAKAAASGGSTAAATALQWNTLAALTHAAGSAATASQSAGSGEHHCSEELLVLAQRLHLLLPFAADHMHSNPPRQRPSQAAHNGFSLLSVAECASAAAGPALLSAGASPLVSRASPAMDAGVLALRSWLREQPATAANGADADDGERWAVAMLQAASPAAGVGGEGGDRAAPLLFPLGAMRSATVVLQDTKGGAAALEGAVELLFSADGALPPAAAASAQGLPRARSRPSRARGKGNAAPQYQAGAKGPHRSVNGAGAPLQPQAQPAAPGAGLPQSKAPVSPAVVPGSATRRGPSLTVTLQGPSE